MGKIKEDIVAFTQALQEKQPVVCSHEGKWKIEGCIQKSIRWIFRQEESRVFQVSKAFCQALDELETVPVKFGCDANTLGKQKQIFQSYQAAGEEIRSALQAYKTKRCLKALGDLNHRLAGLLYRAEAEPGGKNPTQAINETDLARLQKAAHRWKSGQTLAPEGGQALSTEDIDKLKEVSRYPLFAAALLQTPHLQEEFFRWALRDNNGVCQWVEFPSTCSKLKSSHLSGRIGHFGPELLSIKKKNAIPDKPEEGRVKILRLPFETQEGSGVKKVSILNPDQTITLRGGWQITVKTFLNIFANKNFEVGNLEFFGRAGMRNWNSHHLGWWNPKAQKHETIHLNADKWWQQLPDFETLSKEKLEKRYALPPLNGSEWVAIPRSTREFLGTEIAKSHGFLEIAIPLGNGNYSIYDFGKFAAVFPRSDCEVLSFLANTVVGKITYPDENVFYSHRQHAAAPFLLEPEQGVKLMEMVRQDLEKSLSNNIIFQLPWENCAYWPQSLLEKLIGKKKQGGEVPNLFRTRLVDTQSPHAVGAFLSVLRMLPRTIQWAAIRVLEVFMRTARGLTVMENGKEVFKCAGNSPFRRKYKVFLPARLHLFILEKKVRGIIWNGARS